MNRPLMLALIGLPFVASAQVTSAITLGAGFRNFGTRLESPAASFSYANSAEFTLGAERKISRRMGVMVAVVADPFSAQNRNDGNVGIFDDISAFGGSLALSFRFKPTAPIYLFGGATFMHFSGNPDPDEADGGVNEPGGTLGFGIDKSSGGRYNARLQIAVHLMKAAEGNGYQTVAGDPVASPNTAKSLSQDWSFTVVIRRALKKE